MSDQILSRETVSHLIFSLEKDEKVQNDLFIFSERIQYYK
jgi:hypothetical protein